jgi:flagellar basal body rod protein FlgB
MIVSQAATIERVSEAMSLRALQVDVIASNVANRDTEGYQRMRVRFDSAMRRADAVRVEPDPTGTPPSIEDDLAQLASTSMRYHAMASSLSRYFSLLATIANPARA